MVAGVWVGVCELDSGCEHLWAVRGCVRRVVFFLVWVSCVGWGCLVVGVCLGCRGVFVNWIVDASI